MQKTSRRILFPGLLMAALIAMAGSKSWAQTETILHSFTNGSDGGTPYYQLAIDGKGNLYGTAEGGGTDSGGVVFELSPNSDGTWTQTVLYNFTGFFGTGDGAFPTGGVTFDSKGNLYGVTSFGGTYEEGIVYQLTPGSNGTWTETVLYSFTGGADGGGSLFLAQGLTIDSAGNLYGTTTGGGTNGYGVAFELSPSNSGTWTDTVLHSFTGADDGSYPYARLIPDAAGNLYGAAIGGGAHDYGVLFELEKGANGSWTEKTIYAFTGAIGSSAPISALSFDQSGNIYFAGFFDLVEMTRNSNGVWTQKNVHEFTGGSADGANAYSGLLFDSAGNVYGTTNTGGEHLGTVYVAKPNSTGSWPDRILHSFTGGDDGKNPAYGALVMDAHGNLYGATSSGGASGFGVVYQIKP